MLTLHPCSCEINCYDSSTRKRVINNAGLRIWMIFKNVFYVQACISTRDKYQWGFGAALSIEDDFGRFFIAEPSPFSPHPHPHPQPRPLCHGHCLLHLPECSVPASTSTGDVWSIPLSPGNRHVQSPPPGADAGMEGREWVEIARLSVNIQTGTCCNTRTWLLVAPCHKCAMY